MAKLTQKIARDYVRMLGGRLVRNVEFDEYVVKFGSGDKLQEYFCTDLDDAIGTARIMAGGHGAFPDAERYLTDMGVDVRETRSIA